MANLQNESLLLTPNDRECIPNRNLKCSLKLHEYLPVPSSSYILANVADKLRLHEHKYQNRDMGFEYLSRPDVDIKFRYNYTSSRAINNDSGRRKKPVAPRQQPLTANYLQNQDTD